jgi:hypothetical protein
MLTGRFEDAGELTPDQLRADYEAAIADAIDGADTGTAAERAGVDAATVEAVLDGEAHDVELTDAAELLALGGEYPDADTVVAEARDVLLLGMTTAVMDVDALSSAIGGEIAPKLIQQKVEGRHPITLAEYATLHHAIEAHKR